MSRLVPSRRLNSSRRQHVSCYGLFVRRATIGSAGHTFVLPYGLFPALIQWVTILFMYHVAPGAEEDKTATGYTQRIDPKAVIMRVIRLRNA